MSEKRKKVIPTIFTVILDGSKVLLLERANTGWMDGYYDLPAGHLKDQEHLKNGAARELYEETNLKVAPDDLKLAHVFQNHTNPKTPYYGYLYLAKRWSGTPKNMEPSKCTDIQFFELGELPEKVTPYIREALEQLDVDEVTHSFNRPGSLDNY